MQGEYKLKEGAQINDPALDGVRFVTVLDEDDEGTRFSICREGQSPRTLTLGTDYFHGLFKRVT